MVCSWGFGDAELVGRCSDWLGKQTREMLQTIPALFNQGSFSKNRVYSSWPNFLVNSLPIHSRNEPKFCFGNAYPLVAFPVSKSGQAAHDVGLSRILVPLATPLTTSTHYVNVIHYGNVIGTAIPLGGKLPVSTISE